MKGIQIIRDTSDDRGFTLAVLNLAMREAQEASSIAMVMLTNAEQLKKPKAHLNDDQLHALTAQAIGLVRDWRHIALDDVEPITSYQRTRTRIGASNAIAAIVRYLDKQLESELNRVRNQYARYGITVIVREMSMSDLPLSSTLLDHLEAMGVTHIGDFDLDILRMQQAQRGRFDLAEMLRRRTQR